MKKTFMAILAVCMSVVMACALTGCAKFNPDKNITVVARENSSGTREAFDTVVTDGTHFLMEKVNGEKTFYTTKKADVLNTTGAVVTKVQSDKQAIGYVSLGSVGEGVKVVKVGGILPSKAGVLDGTYKIQRPFVVMTKHGQTLTPLAADFLNFLKSDAIEAICDSEDVGTVFLKDPAMRANKGDAPISVSTFTKQATLPAGDKIIVRGSTSMEKLIYAAAKAYAKQYNVDATAIFNIELEGSSKGVSAVEKDTNGDVIGLSSAAVKKDAIDSFNVCLDAVAVIVNPDNDIVNDLSLAQLYDIFTGKTTKYSQLANA